MLKRIAYGFACPVCVFLMYLFTMSGAAETKLLGLQMIMYVFPIFALAYGFLGYKIMKFLSCIIVGASFLFFCFRTVGLSAVIWVMYYVLMCALGAFIKRKMLNG